MAKKMQKITNEDMDSGKQYGSSSKCYQYLSIPLLGVNSKSQSQVSDICAPTPIIHRSKKLEPAQMFTDR
jgi:hypothetical protein